MNTSRLGYCFRTVRILSDQRREAAYYVDKIRKGAKPGDLAIRQAGVFEIVINVTTAKRIGVAVPPFFLQTIDAKIE